MSRRKRAVNPGQPRKGESGVSLILVMLAILVLSVLAAAIVFTARSETLASNNFKLDTQADYLAKAGIQQALNWLRSTRYQSVTQSQANTYYAVTSTGSPYNYWTSNVSPVQCISGCSVTSGSDSRVQFSSIPGGDSTNYPLSGVVTNFETDFPSGGLRVTGDGNNSGLLFVDMVLLNYQTVGVGTPPSVTAAPVETWLITARAQWTRASSSSGAVAVAEERAAVQPIYLPTWGNALYGYCSVTMGGSAGTCTDAFNSSLGPYAEGNLTAATAGCNSTTEDNVIAAGAGVGANGGVTLGSNVRVSGNVTIGTDPSAGCGASGYSGSTSSVLGEVVSGPHINPPAVPTFRTGFPGSAPSYSLSGSVQILPASVTTWPLVDATSPFPDTTHMPPLTAGGPCMDSSCDGTQVHPYEINSVTMTGSNPALRLIGGPNVFNPVYYNLDSFSQNQGQVQVSGYVVLNIKTSLSIAGNGIANGIADSIPPECVQINYAGTNTVTISGNGAVSAILTAPNATVKLGGGGSNGYMVGAIQANNVTVQGGYPIHYDVQLNRAGGQMGVMVTTGYSRRRM